jgi:hypothetical protein
MNDTKQRVITTIRAAIKAEAPKLICFRHLDTVTNEELGPMSRYEFEVQGKHFSTGWADPEYYSFVEHTEDTSALTIQDLKLLLWWLEEGDTKVVEQVREPYQYLA